MPDNFIPITDRDESERLFKLLKTQWRKNAHIYSDKLIGFQGGGHHCQLYWKPDICIWGVFELNIIRNRFWICWGDIHPDDPFSIVVETNPPFEGINKRVSGSFVKDEKGRIFLSHSGRVGGGRKGIGKKAFCEFSNLANWGIIHWPDGKTSQNLILGEIGKESLLNGIKAFVNEVARFKKWAVSQPRTTTLHPQIKETNENRIYKLLSANSSQAMTNEEIKSKLAIKHHSQVFQDTQLLLNKGKISGYKEGKGWLFWCEKVPVSHKAPQVSTGEIPGETSVKIKFSWKDIGNVKLDENENLTFSKPPSIPGVYKLTIISEFKNSIYIGQTENLLRRFQHYRTPGPSQKTNIRLNIIMIEQLKSGSKITISIISNNASLNRDGINSHANFSKRNERILFEHGALVALKNTTLEVLNK